MPKGIKISDILDNIVNTNTCLSCRLCCVFYPEHEHLAPYFTFNEIKMLDVNKSLFIKKSNYFQAKLLRTNKAGYKKCVFLDRKNYKCQIHDRKPVDCALFPFVIGYGKEERNISLWVVSKKMCPSVKISDISPEIVEGINTYLIKRGVLNEIRNNERYIWEYEPYHIYIKSLDALITDRE
jgi:Fe-S-cluster containining protein